MKRNCNLIKTITICIVIAVFIYLIFEDKFPFEFLALLTSIATVYIAVQSNQKTDEQFDSLQKSRDVDIMFKLIEKNMVSDFFRHMFNKDSFESYINTKRKELIEVNSIIDGYFINDYFFDIKNNKIYYNKNDYMLHNYNKSIYCLLNDLRLIESMIEYKQYKNKIRNFLDMALSKELNNKQPISKKELSYDKINSVKFNETTSERIFNLFSEYYNNEIKSRDVQIKISLEVADMNDISKLDKEVKQSYSNLDLYKNILNCYEKANMSNWLTEEKYEKEN